MCQGAIGEIIKQAERAALMRMKALHQQLPLRGDSCALNTCLWTDWTRLENGGADPAHLARQQAADGAAHDEW